MIAKLRYAASRAMLSALVAAVPFAASAETITAASDVGLPPFAFSGDDGKYRGIDMDIAAALSEQIGAAIEIIDQPWSTTYPGLNAKKFDIVLAPATVSAERAKAMLFVEPYGDAIYGFLTKKAGPKITTIDDLRGKTIAVNKGNLFDRWLSQREAQYGWTINRFDKTSDAAAAVASGQADAAMMYVAAAGWMSKQNAALAPSTFTINNGEVYAYSVRLADKELRERLDRGLECLKQKGTLAAIFKKWTDLDPAPGGAVVTIAAGYGVPGFANYDETPHSLSCK
ncbi:polar amino acid transport system substrate-binding protein [Bradyrhizobium sp. F1.4.3]|uniref:substrate-binding periplasmic protein n=1 Tax=Bradyrhizobium sp. F1.4.3 TaxID=3156356 RepID=UPI003391EF5F